MQYIQRRMQELNQNIHEITTRLDKLHNIQKGEKGFHTKEILNDKLYNAKRESEYYNNQKYQELNRYQQQNGSQVGCTMNLISPDFKEILNDNVYKDYFSDHKIVEEIANASLLQKKNEYLIFKYGTLDKINEKLSTMLYKKIDLINNLEFDDMTDDENIVPSSA